jgi:hypothetical protein
MGQAIVALRVFDQNERLGSLSKGLSVEVIHASTYKARRVLQQQSTPLLVFTVVAVPDGSMTQKGYRA